MDENFIEQQYRAPQVAKNVQNPEQGPNAAREFALARHGKQEHGCLDISEHLADVVKNVAKHYSEFECHDSLNDIMSAAWLHDVLEDTDATSKDISDQFGVVVRNIVMLLTDKKGKSRMERHLNTYWAIREDSSAVLIKLCDRRHNHERSIAYGEKYATMYRDEFVYFKFALWRPRQFVKLWAELDAQYEELKRMLSW